MKHNKEKPNKKFDYAGLIKYDHLEITDKKMQELLTLLIYYNKN